MTVIDLRALAESGQPEAALAHFRIALEADPKDTQALFFSGLVHEGLGRIDAAVDLYCQSMSAEANSPSADRLLTLGRACP